MSLHAVTLSLVVDAALGAWLGVMAFFSFVGAPRAFAVYDDAGGRYVNDVFPRYYRLGVVLGLVAAAAGLGLGATAGLDAAVAVQVGLSALAAVLAGYSVLVLVPRMEAAGEGGFARYHRQSVALNGVAMLAVAGALVAAHVPG